MAKRLAIIDPGKNTGVCLVQPLRQAIDFTLWSGTPLEAVQFIEDWVTIRESVIVCERFTVTSVKHTRQYDALEVIGALRYVAHRTDTRFELQARSDRMLVPLDVARRFARPADDDQESALRHAVVAAVRHGLVDPVTYVVRFA